MRNGLHTLAIFLLAAAHAAAADWIRSGLDTNQPVWGLRGGLVWGLHLDDPRVKEPRGLIRLCYPTLPGGRYALINFMAVEPVVQGQRGFSELEQSGLDNAPGKRLWADALDAAAASTNRLQPGKLTRLPSGAEQLEVLVRVEKFDNGAHVRLRMTQRSDAPDELQLTVHTEPDSAPLSSCILTATMGNMTRTRLLWLKDEVVSSLQLYPNHQGTNFTRPTVFPLPRLARTARGDVLVAVTTDEADLAPVYPVPGRKNWHYGGSKVTQYWRMAPGTFGNDLQAAVNARATYYASSWNIPGGVAFENFELRARFHEDQTVIFGFSPRTPAELGLKAQPSSKRVPGSGN